MYPATVSTFRLDTYEITVGRFRNFAAGYPNNKPVAGSGKNPNNSADPGWDASWPLPADQALLVVSKTRGRCGDSLTQPTTWTATPGANENLPMTCMTWYEAYAFCIWDGGRLPTEAEWNYAAAGGSEQRHYPWSNPPASETIDATYAVYDPAPAAPVGSKSPKGDGRWGHADLAGNLWEWVQDWLATYPIPCIDCANLTAPSGGSTDSRVDRGAGVSFPPYTLLNSNRGNVGPASNYGDVGARCARNP